MITYPGTDHAFPVSTESWHYRLQIAAFGEMPAKNFCPYWRLLMVAPFVIAWKRVVRAIGPRVRPARLRRAQAARWRDTQRAQGFALWDQHVRQALEVVKAETDPVGRARRLLDLDALLWTYHFPRAHETRSIVFAWAWKDAEGCLDPSRPSFLDLVGKARVLLREWDARQRRARYGRLAVWGPRVLLWGCLAVAVSLFVVASYLFGWAVLRVILAGLTTLAFGFLGVGGTVLAVIGLTKGFGTLWKSDTVGLLRARVRVVHDRICPPLVVVDSAGNPVGSTLADQQGGDDAR